MRPLIERVAKRYWDEFYRGMMAVGLKPDARPKFMAGGQVESETVRCMRHAMEELREPTPEMIRAAEQAIADADGQYVPAALLGVSWRAMLSAAFPDRPYRRKSPLTANDEIIRRRAGAGYQ